MGNLWARKGHDSTMDRTGPVYVQIGRINLIRKEAKKPHMTCVQTRATSRGGVFVNVRSHLDSACAKLSWTGLPGCPKVKLHKRVISRGSVAFIEPRHLGRRAGEVAKKGCY